MPKSAEVSVQEQPLLRTHWLTCSSELLEQGRDVTKWSDLCLWNITPVTQESLSHLLFFKPAFKFLLLFNEMLRNKTDRRKQLANHPVMKAKDVNCLPAIFHTTNLPSDPHLAGEDTTQRRFTVASSLWISCPFPRKACSGGHPEHTQSYLESGEGPNWEATGEQEKPNLPQTYTYLSSF